MGARKFQEDLKVGDTVKVWWGRKAATITGFKSHRTQEGWRVAVFGDGHSMTLFPFMVLEVLD